MDKVKLINLRKAGDEFSKEWYEPVSGPSTVVIPTGWRPLANVCVGGRNETVVCQGTAIAVWRGAVLIGITDVGRIAKRGIAVGDGELLVLTADGALIVVDIESSTMTMSIRPDYDGLQPLLRAKAAGNVYSSVAPVKADMAEARTGVLSASVRRALATATVDAWSELEDAARRAGGCLGGRLARVRISDSDGNEIFSTEPVWLSHPEGKMFSGAVNFDEEGSTGCLGSPELSAALWRPEVEVSEKLIRVLPSGAMIEVEMSSEQCGFTTRHSPRVSGRRRGGDPLATVTFARRSVDVYSALQGKFWTVWRSRCVAGKREISVGDGAEGHVYGESRQSVVGADTVAVQGDVVAYGGVRLRCPAPMGIEAYAVGVDDDVERGWHGFATVEFSDGTLSTVTSEGIGAYPRMFSPVICYGASDAVAITLAVMSGAEVRKQRFELVSIGCGSVYVSPSLEASELPVSGDVYAPPASTNRVRHGADTVAFAATTSPTRVFATAVMAGSRVNALAAAVGAQSAWDYGRSRFYSFTSGGIMLLQADPHRRTASMSIIDGREVGSSQAVCRIDGAVAAVGSGDVIVLSGNRVRRIGRVDDAKGLAWNHARHELWCLTPRNVEVLCLDDGVSQYSMPAVYDVDATVQTAHDTTYIVENNQVKAVGNGRTASWIDIRYEAMLDVEPTVRMGPRLIRLCFDMPGTYSGLKVSVRRADGVHVIEGNDLEFEIDGRLSAPIRRGVLVGSSTELLNVVLEGKAMADCRVKRIKIV